MCLEICIDHNYYLISKHNLFREYSQGIERSIVLFACICEPRIYRRFRKATNGKLRGRVGPVFIFHAGRALAPILVVLYSAPSKSIAYLRAINAEMEGSRRPQRAFFQCCNFDAVSKVAFERTGLNQY